MSISWFSLYKNKEKQHILFIKMDLLTVRQFMRALFRLYSTYRVHWTHSRISTQCLPFSISINARYTMWICLSNLYFVLLRSVWARVRFACDGHHHHNDVRRRGCLYHDDISDIWSPYDPFKILCNLFDLHTLRDKGLILN